MPQQPGGRGPSLRAYAPLGEHRFVAHDGERLPVGGGTEPLGVGNVVAALGGPARERR